MTDDAQPRRWPDSLAAIRIEGSDVVACDESCEEKPGRDSLGNPGRMLVSRRTGTLAVRLSRGSVVQRLVARGLAAVRDTAEETELVERAPAVAAADVDPFLIERLFEVTVRGRELPARQRDVIEAKVASLSREYSDVKTPPDRRATAELMLRELGAGLSCTMEARIVERRFQPSVAVRDPIASMGTAVPLSAGSRIVYAVEPVKPEPSDDGPSEPMVFHVVALGQREAVVLYTGGVHGHRHLRDLETSAVHHAWFSNRERVKTEATAPWISRALFRDLAEKGHGSLVVEKRRDTTPVTVERTGRGAARLLVDGAEVGVPVLHCTTSAGDALVVLDDGANPLVLSLEERGSELLRTVLAVHTKPLPNFSAARAETGALTL